MKKLFYQLHLLLTFTFYLCPLTLMSQSITWSKIYNPSVSATGSKAICNTSSGFYYVGGDTYLSNYGGVGYIIKINEYGDSLWSKYILGIRHIESMVATPDKGCIISGTSDSSVVARLDSNGSILWLKSFGQDLSFINNIKETAEGKYVACGERFYQRDGIVMKFDINGALVWFNVYPTMFLKNLISIDELQNGGYIITGSNKDSSTDTNKILLMRIDQLGNIIWEKKYKIFNQLAYGGFVKKLNNGFLISGGTRDTINPSDHARMFFIRTDTNGKITYTKLFTFYQNDYFTSAAYLNENRYVFAALVYGPNNDSSGQKVIVSDSLGNIIYSKNYFSNNYSMAFYSIIKAQNNNDIILAGDFNEEAFLVCRVDSTLQGPPIGIKIINNKIPQDFNLFQNYPNPFNPMTTIHYDIPKSGLVRLAIYDILGREIFSISDFKKAGRYEYTFDGSNLSSGVYFYFIKVNNLYDAKRMVLLK